MASASASGVVWTFGKAFPVEGCSRWKGSGAPVKNAGKKAKSL